MFRLACVLLLIFLTYQVGQAKVAPNSVVTREENLSSCVDCRSQRTLYNIIWGCVSTTIICAWAAIHPNIPPREGPLKGALRRLELMFWVIVAPEILPAWALNQLLAAMTVREVYNNGKGYKQERRGIWKTVKGWLSLYEIREAASKVWTLKHGHFLIMGGIHLVEPPEEAGTTTEEANTDTVPDSDQGAVSETITVRPKSASVDADTEKGRGPSGAKPKPRVTILTLEMLKELVKDPEFEIEATEDDITYRSKGDALSKIIFILQSTWFILQCLGRWRQGLNLTPLELTTLALASLNGITFVLWWDKPLGAQAVVRVHLKRRLTDEERNIAGRDQSVRSMFQGICESPKKIVTQIRDIILCRSEGNVFVAWLIRLPFSILLLLLLPTIAFSLIFFATIGDLVGASSSFPADATHVPTYYVPDNQYSEEFHIFLLLVLGTIFGGIHCAGWNLPFPTSSEQKLWRVASLAVTIIPIGAVLIAGITYLVVKFLLSILKSTSSEYDETLAYTTIWISTIAYGSARLVLLGQALALLRHPHPTAFISVDWTKFYPHFL